MLKNTHERCRRYTCFPKMRPQLWQFRRNAAAGEPRGTAGLFRLRALAVKLKKLKAHFRKVSDFII